MQPLFSASNSGPQAPLLNRRTVAHEVASVLREEILRAVLPPGAHLRQEEVAERFGVSTTPVREAFRILEAEGLVRLDPRKGVLVFRPSIEDVLEAYEIREALETLAISFAIEVVTDDEIAALAALLDEMDVTSDGSRWVELNNVYHDEIYATAARPRLRSMILSLRDSVSGYMHSAIQQAVASGRASREHREILEACRARDVLRAQKAVSTHIHHTVELALEYFSPDLQPS